MSTSGSYRATFPHIIPCTSASSLSCYLIAPASDSDSKKRQTVTLKKALQQVLYSSPHEHTWGANQQRENWERVIATFRNTSSLIEGPTLMSLEAFFDWSNDSEYQSQGVCQILVMDPTTELGRATADEACRARHRGDVPKNILASASKRRKLSYPISTTGNTNVHPRGSSPIS